MAAPGTQETRDTADPMTPIPGLLPMCAASAAEVLPLTLHAGTSTTTVSTPTLLETPAPGTPTQDSAMNLVSGMIATSLPQLTAVDAEADGTLSVSLIQAPLPTLGAMAAAGTKEMKKRAAPSTTSTSKQSTAALARTLVFSSSTNTSSVNG